MFESYLKPPISFPTLTGSIVTFNSQYAGLPLKSHTVALTATQSGSGTPSPDNVRPITGYSAINISHSDADTSNPTVHTIQIGSTVYGGEYDARTGVLTVKNFEFVGDTNLIVSKISVSDNLSTYLIRTSTNNFPNAVNNTIISSHFSRDILSGSGRMAQSRNDIYLVIDNTLLSEDTATGFVNWLTTNSVTFVYELATPTTIQLPPCPIDTLQGVNNIWADTGDTTLQYIKFG